MSDSAGSLTMAYADPPYPGQSARHYANHPDYAGEVDHRELIVRLVSDYPDGWALSTSSPALRELLPLCPPDVRVMAWVKPFAAFKRNVRVAYAWEPVIVKMAERLPDAKPTRDFVSEPITMRRNFTGAKPERVCFWLFEVMGLRPGDELDDLFPGSGAVGLGACGQAGGQRMFMNRWRWRYDSAGLQADAMSDRDAQYREAFANAPQFVTEAGALPFACPVCQGRGWVWEAYQSGLPTTNQVACNGCRGTGIVWSVRRRRAVA